MALCNFTEDLTPQDTFGNVFIFCFVELDITFYIVDEFFNIIETDLAENWIYLGT